MLSRAHHHFALNQSGNPEYSQINLVLGGGSYFTEPEAAVFSQRISILWGLSDPESFLQTKLSSSFVLAKLLPSQMASRVPLDLQFILHSPPIFPFARTTYFLLSPPTLLLRLPDIKLSTTSAVRFQFGLHYSFHSTRPKRKDCLQNFHYFFLFFHSHSP